MSSRGANKLFLFLKVYFQVVSRGIWQEISNICLPTFLNIFQQKKNIYEMKFLQKIIVTN